MVRPSPPGFLASFAVALSFDAYEDKTAKCHTLESGVCRQETLLCNSDTSKGLQRLLASVVVDPMELAQKYAIDCVILCRIESYDSSIIHPIYYHSLLHHKAVRHPILHEVWLHYGCQFSWFFLPRQ